jgi:toxin ParE1/3/4
MARYRISEAAAADLDAIWLYVAEHGGVDAADRLIDAIMAGIRLLADHPGMGRNRSDLAPGLQGFPTPDYLDYLIFYRRAQGYIDIVRVLQGSQHLPRFFTH